MQADHIALALTDDPQSLQRALVKVSTAQVGYLRKGFGKSAATNATGGIVLYVKNALRVRCCAIRFFFGDGLFGYAHPFLSERLKALECSSQVKDHEDE